MRNGGSGLLPTFDFNVCMGWSVDLLPGVPRDYVRGRLEAAAGNELASGKIASAESSSALAVNCFAWFHERPQMLPKFLRAAVGFPAELVDVEFCARFPWSGGTHPWLDALVVTPSHVVGIESKRFEPYRDDKKVDFKDAYDRPVWGGEMGPFERMRDALRRGEMHYDFLDAAQLVKHAFGLVTEAGRRNKRVALVYLFAEPSYLKERAIPIASFEGHRAEIADFSERVSGAAVSFSASSYREWLATWPADDAAIISHRQAILDRFAP